MKNIFLTGPTMQKNTKKLLMIFLCVSILTTALIPRFFSTQSLGENTLVLNDSSGIDGNIITTGPNWTSSSVSDERYPGGKAFELTILPTAANDNYPKVEFTTQSKDIPELSSYTSFAYWISMPAVAYTRGPQFRTYTAETSNARYALLGDVTLVDTVSKTTQTKNKPAASTFPSTNGFEGWVIVSLEDADLGTAYTWDELLEEGYNVTGFELYLSRGSFQNKPLYISSPMFIKDTDAFIEDALEEPETSPDPYIVNDASGTNGNVINTGSNWTSSTVSDAKYPSGNAHELTITGGGDNYPRVEFATQSKDIPELSSYTAFAYWISMPAVAYTRGPQFRMFTTETSNNRYALLGDVTLVNTVSKTTQTKNKPAASTFPSTNGFEGWVIVSLEDADLGTAYTWDGLLENEYNVTGFELYLSGGSFKDKPIYISSAMFIKDTDAFIEDVLEEPEPPDPTTDPYIVNNGSGLGDNITGSVNANFTRTYEDGSEFPGGYATALKSVGASTSSVANTFVLNSTNVPNLKNCEALAFWLKVPDLGTATLNLAHFYFQSDRYRFYTKITVIDTVKKTTDTYAAGGRGGRTVLYLSDFEGWIILSLKEEDAEGISTNYDNTENDWRTWSQFLDSLNGNYNLSFGMLTNPSHFKNDTLFFTAFQYLPNTEEFIDEIENQEDVIPDVIPTRALVNDGSGMGANTFGPHNQSHFRPSIINDVSPEGAAMSFDVIGSSGESAVSARISSNEGKLLANRKALAFWVRIPDTAEDVTLRPRVNGDKNYMRSTVTTIDNVTGEKKVYTPNSSDKESVVPINGFEGWVILSLEDCLVFTNEGADPGKSWSEFTNSVNVSTIYFQFSLSKVNKYELVFDSFSYLNDPDAYIAEKMQLPLRPKAPQADLPSGEIPSGATVFLNDFEQAGVTLYYTLDGTVPDAQSMKYELIALHPGFASPIQITNYTVLRIVAITNDGRSSAVITYKYDAVPPYEGENLVVINDGSGTGNNTFNYYDSNLFNVSIEEGDSPENPALGLTSKTNVASTKHVSIKAVTTGLTHIAQKQALVFRLEVPELAEGTDIGLGFRVNAEANQINARVYTLSDEGELKSYNNGVQNINGFEGLVIVDLTASNAVGVSYNASHFSWKDYINSNPLTSFGFYVNRPGNFETKTIIFDDFRLCHDLAKYFEELGLGDLNKEYDNGTFENSNMIITNDGGGVEPGISLNSLTGNITAEKSTASADARCINMIFGKGPAGIDFMSLSKDPDLLIAYGASFWVKAPDGAGSLGMNFKIHEISQEHYAYSDTRWYFLIDKDMSMSRKEGKLAIPNGFEGWVIIPKTSLFFLSESPDSDNIELDFDQTAGIEILFDNSGDILNGKNVLIDDIGFYLDLQKIADTHAVKLVGFSQEDDGNNPPKDIEETTAVTGRLFDEDGNPISGAILKLESGIQTQTDAYGRFEFLGVLPGKNSLSMIDENGKEISSKSFDVVKNSETDLNVVYNGEALLMEVLSVESPDTGSKDPFIAILVALLSILTAAVVFRKKSNQSKICTLK